MTRVYNPDNQCWDESSYEKVEDAMTDPAEKLVDEILAGQKYWATYDMPSDTFCVRGGRESLLAAIRRYYPAKRTLSRSLQDYIAQVCDEMNVLKSVGYRIAAAVEDYVAEEIAEAKKPPKRRKRKRTMKIRKPTCDADGYLRVPR